MNVRPLDTVSEEGELSIYFVREISDSDGVGSYEGMFCKVIYFYSVAERFSGILFFVHGG